MQNTKILKYLCFIPNDGDFAVKTCVSRNINKEVLTKVFVISNHKHQNVNFATQPYFNLWSLVRLSPLCMLGTVVPVLPAADVKLVWSKGKLKDFEKTCPIPRCPLQVLSDYLSCGIAHS
jgi:hypothetical protein